jgi:hypothetical protein
VTSVGDEFTRDESRDRFVKEIDRLAREHDTGSLTEKRYERHLRHLMIAELQRYSGEKSLSARRAAPVIVLIGCLVAAVALLALIPLTRQHWYALFPLFAGLYLLSVGTSVLVIQPRGAWLFLMLAIFAFVLGGVLLLAAG